MAQVTFTVPNISCGHCVATIERVVMEIEGVSEVSADAGTKQVVVRYDSPATREAIVAVMTEWEYPPA